MRFLQSGRGLASKLRELNVWSELEIERVECFGYGQGWRMGTRSEMGRVIRDGRGVDDECDELDMIGSGAELG